MTVSQRRLAEKLLTGYFLRLMKRNGRTYYVLYDQKINPIMKVRRRTVKSFDRSIDPELQLWKRNIRGDISLNLATVRQLDGRSTLKRLYKKRNEINPCGNIYKNRIKKPKKVISDEKVNYLF